MIISIAMKSILSRLGPLYLVAVTFFFSCFAAYAQPAIYAYQLYKAAGTAPVTALGIGSEDNTNGYVVGGFNTSMTIAGIPVSNPGGWPNVFLCKFKYNVTNAPQWIKAPVTDYSITNARAGADSSPFTGNGYIAGNFEGTNLTFGTTTLTNNATDHSDDIFLVKYDFNGTLKYLVQAGGAGDDILGDSVTDGNGNTYMTGSFLSSTFSAGASNLVRQSTTGSDCFVIKYNNSGGVTWLNQGSYASGTCVAFDAVGDCYVGGDVLGSSVFGGVSPANQTTTKFLAEYSSSGSLDWVRGDDTIGNYLAVDKAQNIYTAGVFSNVVQFGAISLTNSSPRTIFVAKYDSNGNILWAQQVPGWGCDGVTGLVVDPRTNCWVSVTSRPPIHQQTQSWPWHVMISLEI
jgi:hypothetical protein